MPELPEVETIVRGLRSRLTGRRVARVCIAHPGIVKGRAAALSAGLECATVREVRRFGKHILLRVGRRGQAGSHWLIVHLGMTGQLVVEPTRRAVRRHTHAWLELEGGESLRYIDPRRFGRLRVTPGEDLPEELSRLGPEPLEIGEEDFVRRVRSRAARMKSLLLDQRFLRGVGNIYADETLFRAGIHPATPGRRISPKRARNLWRAMRRVLQEAIALGGSSVSNYVDAAGQPGGFQFRHRVYGRAGQPCVNCGARLRRAIIAGRGTAWCPKCQRK
jgi:formamidopyrimidine-DNA glycosylase